MTFKTYEVNIRFTNGVPAQKVILEANNPPQARQFAEARYPGSIAGGCRQV